MGYQFIQFKRVGLMDHDPMIQIVEMMDSTSMVRAYICNEITEHNGF